MASKNDINIYYLSAIRYTYLNLDAGVIFVPKKDIGDEFHYVLIFQCCAMIITIAGLTSYTENSHLCTN